MNSCFFYFILVTLVSITYIISGQGVIITEPSMVRASQYYVDSNVRTTIYFPDEFYLHLTPEDTKFQTSRFIMESLEVRTSEMENILLYGIYHNPDRFFFFLEDISKKDSHRETNQSLDYQIAKVIDIKSNFIIWHKKTDDDYRFYVEKTKLLEGRQLRYVLTGFINKPFHRISKAHLNFELGILLDVFDFILDDETSLESGYRGNILQDISNYFYSTSNYNYVSTLKKIQSLEREAYSKNDSSGFYETLVVYLNFLGENYELSQLPPYKERIEINSRKVAHIKDQSVLNEYDLMIDSIAHYSDILIFNEDHYSNFNRNTLKKSLKCLSKHGFKYLAIETLVNSDENINLRGYPLQNSGFYTSDPVFANLVRMALDLGFILIPYEVTNYQENDEKIPHTEFREKQQAINILNGTSSKISEDKVVVYCGRAHGSKRTNSEYMMMAAWLDSLTNVRVTSIDQVISIGVEKEYTSLRRDMLLSSPAIKEYGYDYLFINNGSDNYDNCPSFCYRLGAYTIDLVSLFPRIDKGNAVFIYDMFEYNENGVRAIPLIGCRGIGSCYLDKGEYIINIINEDGIKVFDNKISVGL